MFSFGGKSGHCLDLAEKEEARCPSQILMKFEHPKNLADDPANDRPAGRNPVGPTSNFYESYKRE
jgi:hypothetical protein